MGCNFVFPQTVVKEVDKKCTEFLWSISKEGRKIDLVSWDSICRPKSQGGLNIKNCKLLNIASIGKLIWLLMHKKEAFWVKWIHGIYLNKMVFWDYVPA